MRTTRHSLMAKGIMVLLSLLVLIIAFTYGWYVQTYSTVDSTGIKINTSTNASFDVAIGFTTPDTDGYKITDWTNGNIDFTNLVITGDSGSPYNLLAHFKPVDLTGDGVTLIRPEMLSKNVGINLSKDTYEIPTENKEYISFDLIVRSSAANVKVTLEPDCYVIGKIEGVAADTVPNNSALVISSGDSKSDYGDFSEDSVVGAVRMSFVDYTSDMNTYAELITDDNTLASSPSVLWIPRPDIYLKANNGITGWELICANSSGTFPSGTGNYADSTSSNPHTGNYKDITTTHYYYGIFEGSTHVGGVANYRTASAVFDLNTTSLENRTIVTTNANITNVENGKSYYYSKCRVNLWVDGCDAEARRAIDKGQFWFKLSLNAS